MQVKEFLKSDFFSIKDLDHTFVCFLSRVASLYVLGFQSTLRCDLQNLFGLQKDKILVK